MSTLWLASAHFLTHLMASKNSCHGDRTRQNRRGELVVKASQQSPPPSPFFLFIQEQNSLPFTATEGFLKKKKALHCISRRTQHVMNRTMSDASLFLLLLLSLNLCDTQAKVIFIAHLLTNSLSFMNIPQILSPLLFCPTPHYPPELPQQQQHSVLCAVEPVVRPCLCFS